MKRGFSVLPLTLCVSLLFHAAFFLLFPGFRLSSVQPPSDPSRVMSLFNPEIIEPAAPLKTEPEPPKAEAPAPRPAEDYAAVDEIPPEPEKAEPENSGQAAVSDASEPAPEERRALTAAYVTRNFDYIQRRIRDNLVDPPGARRTGAQGRAEAVFTIHADGGVSGVTIRISSGVEILDKALVDAIRASAPIPPPPVPARIAVPITFRLR
jgi:protein TonB